MTDAETGAPIAGAIARLALDGRTAVTDGEGRFLMDHVPSGPQDVTVSVVGYILVKRTTTVSAGAVVELTIPIAQGTGTFRESVTVRGDTFPVREPSVLSQDVLTAGALQNLRGVMLDDPLRAVQALPGVGATDDLHSLFAIRGSDSRRTRVG